MTTQPTSEMIEAVARAMFEDSLYGSIRWETATEELKNDFRKPAKAAIAAYEKFKEEN